MKSKGKVKLCFPTKKSKLPLQMRLHSCELRTPEPQRPPSLVVDLTMDSGSDEEAAPPNATQVCQPRFRPLALSQLLHPPVGKFLWNLPPLSHSLNHMFVLSSRNLIPALHATKARTNANFFIGPRSQVPRHRRRFHTHRRGHLHHPRRLAPLRHQFV